jgi:hypothetical protein
MILPVTRRRNGDSGGRLYPGLKATQKMFVYAIFTSTGEMVSAQSIDAAKQLILDRFPNAHFGHWVDAERARNLVVWENAGEEFKFEMGLTDDENKPVGYVRVQDFITYIYKPSPSMRHLARRLLAASHSAADLDSQEAVLVNEKLRIALIQVVGADGQRGRSARRLGAARPSARKRGRCGSGRDYSTHARATGHFHWRISHPTHRARRLAQHIAGRIAFKNRGGNFRTRSRKRTAVPSIISKTRCA